MPKPGIPHTETPPDEELDNWPLIPSEVPQRMLGFVEQWKIEDAIEWGVRTIREEVKRLITRGDHYVNEENSIQYRFLLQTMLATCRTVEQVQKMVIGYLNYCIRECGQFRSPLLDMARDMDIRVIDRSFHGSDKMSALRSGLGDEAFDCLNQYGRHPILETVPHGMAERPVHRYAGEPFYDGAFAIMADPTHVKNCGHEEPIERKVPEDKRMTPEKLARLLQLPSLEQYIVEDVYVHGPVCGSNFAIIAEYFCENHGSPCINSITPEMIEEWMRLKFRRHKPILKVAYYAWCRFQQTSFEKEAAFIEEYILDVLAEKDPWIFELTQRPRSSLGEPGAVFDLFTAAMEVFDKRQQDPQLQRLLKLLPAREIVAPFQKSDTEAYQEPAKRFLKGYKVSTAAACPDYNKKAFEEDPEGFMLRLFNDQSDIATEWEVNEGFELLDPIAINGISGSLRGWAINVLRNGILSGLDKMPLTALFIFRNTIIKNIVDREYREKLEALIAERIETAYVESIGTGSVSTEVLIDMAQGREVDHANLVPEVAALPPEMRRAPSPQRLSSIAEAALISRHFRGTHGGDEIVRFLMSNRRTMHPAELIMPFPDAPNLEIIKRYGESPNLLIYLAMATIQMYLGYSYEQVLASIDELVERTEMESRPELSTVGVEWEQSGGIGGTVIATDLFAELFNVLPAGNDRSANEVLTLPTTSTLAQNALIDIVTNPEHGYLDTAAMWAAQASTGETLSSLHINIGLPKDVVHLTTTEVTGHMSPLVTATWLAHGGDSQYIGARGMVRRWSHDSLLDVVGDKNPNVKLEIRNAALEPDHSHTAEIDEIFLIASACAQGMRIANGVETTSTGAVMAEIFQAFQTEVERLQFAPDQATSARDLLRTYAKKIRQELGLAT